MSGGIKFPDGTVQTMACNNQVVCALYRMTGINPAECLSQISDTGQMTSYTSTFGEDNDYSIRPQSFTDNGTVTDNVSGPMWQKEDDDKLRRWISTLGYCADLSLGGYADWRLPEDGHIIVHVDIYLVYPLIFIY